MNVPFSKNDVTANTWHFRVSCKSFDLKQTNSENDTLQNPESEAAIISNNNTTR